ncbi:MAG: molybdopterin biosynthesis protein [Methanomicrobiales archaeon]|nr:molybdopterin biosynthesis protein [Methanomicrobiales archaeon]
MVRRYLDLVTLEEAIVTLKERFPHMARTVRVPVTESVGRVTASPVFARFSVPEAPLAAMDGIAVLSAETREAREQHPVILKNAIRVNTGNVVLPPFDAVIMIEDVWEQDEGYVIRKSVPPWQHIRPAGEDIGEGEMILTSSHLIRPHDIGALLAFGIGEVEVKGLTVGLIPTGSEIVPIGTRPKAGQAVETNTHVAGAWLRAMGAGCRHYPIVPDVPDAIRNALLCAVRENDMVLISAGSSAGTKDFTVDTISMLGRVLVHGVAIKPGKPVIIGEIQGKPVIGLPGYPLSTLTVLREIVTPFLVSQGFPAPGETIVKAYLATGVSSEIGIAEFLFVIAGHVDGRWVAVPLSRGAGVQMSAVRSNGCVRIAAEREGQNAGDEVEVRLWMSERAAMTRLIITGSHDPSLDYLADLLTGEGVWMHAVPVGSMGGLLALKGQYCHAAPMHLLAPDGSYNTYYLRRHLPGEELALLKVAGRAQGIASKSGITLEEMPAHTFVNRQKGSGTRMLLDHLLQTKGIEPSSISGYTREVTTHLAAARSVAMGEADACVCTFSAAKLFGLSFVWLAEEEYELVLHRDALKDDRIQRLCECVGSDVFKDALARMGGYETGSTGTIRYLGGAEGHG